MTSGQQMTFDATPEELNLFLSEGEEQLEILSQDILRLENEGDTNNELLQEIFRAAHTLKGSSGAIGHQRMARLTHALETVLDNVRHHKLAVSTHLVDLLLQGVDALRVLLEEVSTGIESDVVIDDLSSALVALTQGDTAPAPTPKSSDRTERSEQTASPTESQPSDWCAKVAVDPACLLPSARGLQVVLAIETVGKIINMIPDRSVIEEGQMAVEQVMLIWFEPISGLNDPAMRVQRALDRIPEVRLLKLLTPTGEATLLAGTKKDHHNEKKRWRITVAIDEGCVFPAVRSLQILIAGGAMGTVVESTPTFLEAEKGKVPEGLKVFMSIMPDGDATEEGIRKVIDRIPETKITELQIPRRRGKQESVSESAANKPEPKTAAKANQVHIQPPVAADEAAIQPKAVVHEHPSTNAQGAEGIAISNGDSSRVAPSHAPRMVRIDVERLDALMNLVGELVIDRTRLARIATRLGTHTDEPLLVEELTETTRHLARISDDLQDEVMRSRMLPIESVFSKFPRLVRDLALKVGKKIEFIVEGKDTELDRSVAEQISDPIIHLLRNSIDHGIESEELRRSSGKSEVGQIRLSARHEENQIVIDVEDDGQGINAENIKNNAVSKGLLSSEAAARMSDREALELIFASGFTTAEKVSDISGRGVGMDIVRTNVERLNGSVTLETEVGQGTRFTVRLPLTLAIIRALLVDVAGQTYAIPLSSVVEALRIEHQDLRSVNGHEAIELRGQVLPLVRLTNVFNLKSASSNNNLMDSTDRSFVVAVRWGERRGGLIVDSLIGEQEIVIKSLGHLFRGIHGISGGAVLGDGRVAPIMDIAALIKHIIETERKVLAS
jgi:two-component system, chemotaxis family, sensor kinase CheA